MQLGGGSAYTGKMGSFLTADAMGPRAREYALRKHRGALQGKILQEDPTTWGRPQYPDLKDLERFLNHKYERLLIGGGSNESSDKEMDLLNNLYREKRRLEKLEKGGTETNQHKDRRQHIEADEDV